MRKASRHSAILLLIGVFALGLLGAAYTLWYENLTLEANITTGTLDADVSLHAIDDNGVMGPAITTVGNYPGAGHPVVAVNQTATVATLVTTNYAVFGGDWSWYGKDKPPTTCDAAISTNAAGANGNTGDSNVLTLTMGGLFPYAGCEYAVDIHNSGTVPFHIALVDGYLKECDLDDDGAIIPSTCVAAYPAPWSIGLDPANDAKCTAFLSSIWGPNNLPQLNDQIDIDDVGPLQLHQGDEVLCRFKLILDQAPVEGTGWVFSATWMAYQWNELPNPIVP